MQTKQLNKCQFCDNMTDIPNHYISMCLPVPRLEKMIDKWGREDWFKNLENNPKTFTPEQNNELEEMVIYDQLLNTVGRGYQCKECIELEDDLMQQYYLVQTLTISGTPPTEIPPFPNGVDMEDDLPF